MTSRRRPCRGQAVEHMPLLRAVAVDREHDATPFELLGARA
ncbi:hypothetical protein [uncultured Cellulomonas sp.]|nr:hypothetical protein [uncultured Cellulomonas sp.]